MRFKVHSAHVDRSNDIVKFSPLPHSHCAYESNIFFTMCRGTNALRPQCDDAHHGLFENQGSGKLGNWEKKYLHDFDSELGGGHRLGWCVVCLRLLSGTDQFSDKI